jgi:hypothetical protein
MKKTGQITYPNFINECAVYIGKLRHLYNYDLNEKTDKYNRFGKSDEPDILGLKGELVFSYFLAKNDINHTNAKLLNNTPVKEPDIIVGDKKIDVKTINPDAPHLLVNEEAHKKDKNIDTYVFIRLDKINKATYWIYSYDDVDQWDIKFFKYTNAYSKLIKEI